MKKTNRRHLMFPTSIDGAIENLSDRKNMAFSEYVIFVMSAHLNKLGIETDAFGNILTWGELGEPSIEEQALIETNRTAKARLKQKISLAKKAKKAI